jgi:hypothetical protein
LTSTADVYVSLPETRSDPVSDRDRHCDAGWWRRRESKPMPPFSRNGGDARLSWSTREGATSCGSTCCLVHSPGVPWSPPQSWRDSGKRREQCPDAGRVDPGRSTTIGPSLCGTAVPPSARITYAGLSRSRFSRRGAPTAARRDPRDPGRASGDRK